MMSDSDDRNGQRNIATGNGREREIDREGARSLGDSKQSRVTLAVRCESRNRDDDTRFKSFDVDMMIIIALAMSRARCARPKMKQGDTVDRAIKMREFQAL